MTTLLTYCDHMDVGIRELKAKLSEYVERAAQGELIRVTDRGVPRVMLSALPAADRVEEGLREGWISRARQDPPAPFTPVRPQPGRSATDILSEDRGS